MAELGVGLTDTIKIVTKRVVSIAHIKQVVMEESKKAVDIIMLSGQAFSGITQDKIHDCLVYDNIVYESHLSSTDVSKAEVLIFGRTGLVERVTREDGTFVGDEKSVVIRLQLAEEDLLIGMSYFIQTTSVAANHIHLAPIYKLTSNNASIHMFDYDLTFIEELMVNYPKYKIYDAGMLKKENQKLYHGCCLYLTDQADTMLNTNRIIPEVVEREDAAFEIQLKYM